MTTYSFIKGLLVTINSDAPACFGGYVNENYQALEDSAGATRSQLVQLAKNSFTGSFLSDAKKLIVTPLGTRSLGTTER